MKLFTLIVLILIVFLRTGNLLSSENLFNVNNILLERKDNKSIKELANQAIKEGFNQLTERILLKQDISKIANLSLPNIKALVTYYNISKNSAEEKNKVNFSVTFDREKIHDLFYKRQILYSDISEKEFYILPILLKKNEMFIFSNNYFYENFNNIKKNELIEFILPLENIEIIQIINQSKNSLIELEMNLLFKEYMNKNFAIVLIENNNSEDEKIYLKARVQDKIISKSFKTKKEDLTTLEFNDKIINEIKDQIIDLVKSQNLIDVRTPSFLNVRLDLNKKNNLVALNSKLESIDLIESIYVQEFNKDYAKLKIKYLGKLDKIIKQLKNQKIILHLANDQWLIKTL
jgi:hypothetical protein